MLPKETLDRILEINRPFFMDEGKLTYSDKSMYLVKPPTPASLKIHTLTGIAEYLATNKDDLKNPFIQVLDEKTVYIHSSLNGVRSREHYLSAEMNLPGFVFNNYSNLENFIISFQAQFFDAPGTYPKEKALRFLGALTSATIEKYIDNGVSQNVTIESGITGSETIALPVPNQLCLQPYRTFREVDQPSSEFILRIRKSTEGPQVALFEADGKAWQLEAIQQIASWLEEHTEDIPVIA